MLSSGSAMIQDVNVCLQPDGNRILSGVLAGLFGDKRTAAGSQNARVTLEAAFS